MTPDTFPRVRSESDALPSDPEGAPDNRISDRRLVTTLDEPAPAASEERPPDDPVADRVGFAEEPLLRQRASTADAAHGLRNGHANGHEVSARGLTWPAQLEPGQRIGRANGHTASRGNGYANGHGNGNGHAHGNGNGRWIAALSPSEGGDGAILVGGIAEPWTERPIATAPRAPRAAEPAASAPAAVAAWAAEIRPCTDGFYARTGKRLLDFLGAAVGVVLFGPLMLLFAALIKITSRGPVLYRSTRLGQAGRPFTFYKFRSMYAGADRDRDLLLHLNEVDGPVFKISRDPRTTAIGRFMRSTSIDELPQFFNVLRGEMSLVGPRPPLPEEESKYEGWQRRRLEVKPGITCLWQISGRSRLGFDEWMRLDLEYIRRQSLATDLRILWRTIPAVLSRDGAY